MTDSNRHNEEKKSHSEADRLIKNFPKKEQELVRTLWDMSPSAKPQFSEPTGSEVEQSLNKVHRRIQAGNNEGASHPDSLYRLHWRWITAAASVLIIIGAGILLIPHSVDVPYAETRELVLPDGSEVTLNSGSELQYNRFFSLLNRKVELNGEAFFNVQNGDLPFKVLANGATIEVTGTAFNVRSWSDEPNALTEVSVQEGTVRFYPQDRSGQSVTLTAGLTSLWGQHLAEPSDPDSVSLEHALGWKDRKVAYSKKSLGIILQELERRFDVQIELEAESYFNENVTIYYVDPQSVKPILQDICRIKGLRYSKSAQGYRVYR